MALKVLWTEGAARDREEILRFYIQRNESNTYSSELATHYDHAVSLPATKSLMGLQTENTKVRYLIMLDYLIFYTGDQTNLMVLGVWDSRRDPKKRPF